MKYTISYKNALDSQFSYVLTILPSELRGPLYEFYQENNYKAINEIRIKRNSYIYLIADSKNVKTDLYVSSETIDKVFEYLCKGSIYAHINTIKEGYLSVGNGIRVGICGSAVLENNEIVGVKEISSLNIRFPHIIDGASSFVFSLLKNEHFNASILIYSSPGVGKTSILRDLVVKLSRCLPPIRYAVIDSRAEILTSTNNSLNCDAYISYPKGTGIELATKSMTPELIICDEISNEDEALAVLKAVNSGVNLIATTHASSYDELVNKSILDKLISAGVFKYYVGVSRGYGEKKYKFSINRLEKEALVWSF